MQALKLYVASSWRNDHQPMAVQLLRDAGHDVYDFKNPEPGDSGFNWKEIDEGWEQWDVERYAEALEHPIAVAGFGKDMGAMEWADACVLVMPCGRSAHLEAGWFCGKGKPCLFWYPEGVILEPELMVKMGNGVLRGVLALERAVETLAAPVAHCWASCWLGDEETGGSASCMELEGHEDACCYVLDSEIRVRFDFAALPRQQKGGD